MARLCERPGCSEPGAAAYGMIPEDLLFWIAPLADVAGDDHNVLCRRHSDAMVVPRGWTLDDRREPVPRLFMPRPAAPPADDTGSTSRRRRSRTTPDVAGEQLQIDGTGEIARPATDEVPPDTDDSVEPPGAHERVAGREPAAPWSPDFDQNDDLDGLLEVDSPLLARAFRGSAHRRS